MLNLRSISGLAILFTFSLALHAQNTSWTSSASLAVPAAYGMNSSADMASAETKEDFLPYAEPILGIDKEDYENHFEEYRVGSLLDRVLDLTHMELQAIYADSKMREINVSFNANIQQDLLVNVYDQFGKKVMTEMHVTQEGINTYKVSTEDLPDGFYSMVVIGNQDQFIQRFIIE